MKRVQLQSKTVESPEIYEDLDKPPPPLPPLKTHVNMDENVAYDTKLQSASNN